MDRIHRIRSIASRHLMEIVLLAVCLVLAARAPNFLTQGNFLAVLRSVAMQGLIAFGMTMVIIVGEIDLSVGAAAAFAGCLTAYLVQEHWPVPLAMLIAVTVGFGLGIFTGTMRVRYAVPSFITTLALFTSLLGVSKMVTGGFPITSFPSWYSFFGSGYVAGIPFPVLVLLAGFIAMHSIMRFTAFGRAVYATGGNPEAARLAGINVDRVRTLCLGITSALAAISGIMLSARLNSGSPDMADGWELEIIAAVIIGGTSLSGGVGTVWGTLVGVMFIGVIANGMTLMNVPSFTQYVVRGMLIFAAVLVNRSKGSQKASLSHVN